MRNSYGIMDQRKILLYQPQLFLKSKDLLIFPSKDFNKWHSNIKEYLDGLYQIDSISLKKGKSINITELHLASGIINSISEELKHLFHSGKVFNSHYCYVSTLNGKYKGKVSYTSGMGRCDTKIPVITPEMKSKNLNKAIEEINREISQSFKESRACGPNKRKKYQ